MSNQPTEYNYDGSCTTSWYPDSGATNHISNDLSNLNTSVEYNGGTSLQLGNGQGINISHIGQSVFLSSTNPNSRTIVMKNLLHVPHITKNLVSVAQFTKDNNVFLNFTRIFVL